MESFNGILLLLTIKAPEITKFRMLMTIIVVGSILRNTAWDKHREKFIILGWGWASKGFGCELYGNDSMIAILPYSYKLP